MDKLGPQLTIKGRFSGLTSFDYWVIISHLGNFPVLNPQATQVHKSLQNVQLTRVTVPTGMGRFSLSFKHKESALRYLETVSFSRQITQVWHLSITMCWLRSLWFVVCIAHDEPNHLHSGFDLMWFSQSDENCCHLVPHMWYYSVTGSYYSHFRNSQQHINHVCHT